jgi:hypothetical protein
MIFILKRKEIDDGKFGYTETEEVELQSGTEDVPTDTYVFKSDVDQDLISESEGASEYGRRDETSERENEILNLSGEKDNIFVRPVIEDDEGSKEPESASVGANTETTEDTEEEVQLSKLTRMSREDLMNELNEQENKAKMYQKSGTVKRNIQKIIREYRAHEDEVQMKSEDSKYAQEVKQGDYVQLREPEFRTVSEEDDIEMNAEGAREYTDQVTDTLGFDNHKKTDHQQEKDHTAAKAEMKSDVSDLPDNSIIYEDHNMEGEKGRKRLQKLIKKYKMLDQSRGAETPAADDRITDNGTGQEKKPVQKISPAKKMFKKDTSEEVEDFETFMETDETSVPSQMQTIENDNMELKGVKITAEDTNQSVSEIYNDTPVAYVNLQDIDGGITENELPSLNSGDKKRAIKKVIKELNGDSNGTDVNVTEETGKIHVLGNETPIPTSRKKPVIRKVKEKFERPDDTERTPPPANLARNTGEIDNIYEQVTAAEEKIHTKNGIHVQEDDKVSDKIETEAHTAYLDQLQEASTEEYSAPKKETIINTVLQKEIPYEVPVGPEGLALQISASADEKTQTSEPNEDIKLSKQHSASGAASQNAGNLQPVVTDTHETESDEQVELGNIAKDKLGEDAIQM